MDLSTVADVLRWFNILGALASLGLLASAPHPTVGPRRTLRALNKLALAFLMLLAASAFSGFQLLGTGFAMRVPLITAVVTVTLWGAIEVRRQHVRLRAYDNRDDPHTTT